MECLPQAFSFDNFMDNHSAVFICLPTLKLTTFEQQVGLTEIDYTNALSLGEQPQKRNAGTFSSA